MWYERALVAYLRTSKHLTDLYQASIKEKGKNIEMNFTNGNGLDLTYYDVDFFGGERVFWSFHQVIARIANKKSPPFIFRSYPFYTHGSGVTCLMFIIEAFMSGPLFSYVTHSFVL